MHFGTAVTLNHPDGYVPAPDFMVDATVWNGAIGIVQESLGSEETNDLTYRVAFSEGRVLLELAAAHVEENE